jgi:hypothetical protein
MRAALVTLVAVLVTGAGVAIVFLTTWTAAPVAAPSAPPATTPDAKSRDDFERLRASYDKIAQGQKELQQRLDQASRELEEARSRLRATESDGAAEKWKPTPTDKPAMAAPDGRECIVVAVDNKEGMYVLSEGSKDGVQEKMEFEVRRGTETIGSVVVDRVFPNYASASRKPGSAAFAPAAGDVCVRVGSGK